MNDFVDLREAIDHAFRTTSQDLRSWPAPHPDRAPLDEEYSRQLDPGKWRIVLARAEAWCIAAVELGLATLERDVSVRWVSDRDRPYSRVDRLVPNAAGAIPLVVGYLTIEDAGFSAVDLAAGDPAVLIAVEPPCGCEACDSGSQDALDQLDEHVLGVISGQFRRLTKRDRTIVVESAHSWSASGEFQTEEIEAVLTDPSGWREVSGSSWLDGSPGEPEEIHFPAVP